MAAEERQSPSARPGPTVGSELNIYVSFYSDVAASIDITGGYVDDADEVLVVWNDDVVYDQPKPAGHSVPISIPSVPHVRHVANRVAVYTHIPGTGAARRYAFRTVAIGKAHETVEANLKHL